MLNRFKDAVSKSGSKNKDSDKPPPLPKPEKYCYSRPHFLGLNYDESSASRDFALRPIMTPRNPTKMPLCAGYAECINGGKSDFNEDQATATDLHLKSHFRTDIAISCLDISLSNSPPHRQKTTASPGPGSPDLSLARTNKSSSQSPKLKHIEKQSSNDPEDSPNLENHAKEPSDDDLKANLDKENQIDQRISKSEESLSVPSPREIEMNDFVSSMSVEPGRIKHAPKIPAVNTLNQQKHMKAKQEEEEKIELCMGVIQRISILNSLSDKCDSTSVTVEQLVIGALEEAFISMDDLLERETSTYHIKGGCTALVAFLFRGKLYVANAGDSRAILCRGDKVKPMSQDFCAESEKQRLNYLGYSQPELLHDEFTCYEFLHRVNKLDVGKHVLCRSPGREGWILKKTTEDDLKFPLVVGQGKRARVMGTIGVTRCLGDHDLYVYDSDIWIKPFLSPKPEVRVLDLTEGQWSDDDVLIMGSDGLWDTLTNERAAEIVRNSLKQPEQGDEKYTIAAQELAQEVRGMFTGKGWRKKNEQQASFDDITVFVIPLKQYSDKWKQDISECNPSS